MTVQEFSYQFGTMEHVLKAFAMKLCSDKFDADDLYQETAYRAFKYRGMFKSDTNLKAWLVTIMRNTFINHYRKKTKNRTLSDWTSTDFLIDSGDHTTINDAESKIAMEEIEKAIVLLDETLSVPFKMRSIGYRYQEIADELELPLGTVKSRIFLARKELQTSLNASN